MTFDRWWQCDGEWVEPPNNRRDGESGVKRVHDPQLGLLYVKLQTNHLYRSLRHPCGRPTVLRERDALQAVQQFGITVPDIVFAGDRKMGAQWRAVLVTRALDGYRDLFDWELRRAQGVISDQRHQEMARAVGTMLGNLHGHGWQHTNLYPNHVFVSSEEGEAPVRAALIDLENSRRRWRGSQAATRDLQQLRKRCETLFSHADWSVLLQAHSAGVTAARKKFRE